MPIRPPLGNTTRNLPPEPQYSPDQRSTCTTRSGHHRQQFSTRHPFGGDRERPRPGHPEPAAIGLPYPPVRVLGIGSRGLACLAGGRPEPGRSVNANRMGPVTVHATDGRSAIRERSTRLLQISSAARMSAPARSPFTASDASRSNAFSYVATSCRCFRLSSAVYVATVTSRLS